jgi:hypothetical protein
LRIEGGRHSDAFTLKVKGFGDGESISKRYTCDGVHRYHFTLYALDCPVLGLPPGARRQELDRALKGRALGRTQYSGRYGRGQ